MSLDEVKLIAHHAKDAAAGLVRMPGSATLHKLASGALKHLGLSSLRGAPRKQAEGVFVREFRRGLGRVNPYIDQHLSVPGETYTLYKLVNSHWSVVQRGANADYANAWAQATVRGGERRKVEKERPAKKKNPTPAGFRESDFEGWKVGTARRRTTRGMSTVSTVTDPEGKVVHFSGLRPRAMALMDAKERIEKSSGYGADYWRFNPTAAGLAKWVKAVLANDEGSTDAELVAYFVAEGPMSKADAQKWVAQRAKLLELPARSRKNPRNPAGAAAAKFEEFHGRPASRETTITSERHEHEFVAEIGKLIRLVVVADDDSEIELKGFRGALLTMDEAGTQLFIDGGDQSVDLAACGFRKPYKELLILGVVSEVTYFTTKDHLGADGGTARYVHKFGEEGGELPTLLYRPRDESLEFAGGGYTLPAEGIRD